MNNPDDYCPTFDEMTTWLLSYKNSTGQSWTDLGKVSAIPYGTLSNYTLAGFKGDRDVAAKRLYQFKQKIDSQAARQNVVLSGPGFVLTPTARRIQFLLEIAQQGRMTCVATGPGTSKSTVARHYKQSLGGTVYLATLRKSKGHVSGLIRALVHAMALPSKATWTQQMSDHIAEHVRHQKALIIVDEANHATLESLEELRGLHDETGVGVALLGNEELMQRISGHRDRHAYARLKSRIRRYLIQDMPVAEDVAAFLDAWDIVEPDMRKPLINLGLSAGSGGLREVTMVLEDANLLAIGDERPLDAAHIKEAMTGRATVMMRSAA